MENRENRIHRSLRIRKKKVKIAFRQLRIVRFFQAQLTKKENRRFYDAHKEEFEKLNAMLEDDFSRKTVQNVWKYRQTLCKDYLEEIIVEPVYFQKDIFGPAQDEVFIDGGAFSGDTILNLIKEFGGGGYYYKKIYAWEPDKASQKKLLEKCAGFHDIELIPCGLWDKKDELHFDMYDGMGSKVSEKGWYTIQVDSIDNRCSSDKVTFIKMDIEGCEQAALRGAENVIRRDKPRLAICLYHRHEDILKIPFMLKEMVPEYKFYIRHHSKKHTDTVLYATID